MVTFMLQTGDTNPLGKMPTFRYIASVKFTLFTAALCAAALIAAAADTVSIVASADTTILDGHESDFNFGAQRNSPAGATGPSNDNAVARALFKFDLAAVLPAGSTVLSGSISLTVQRTPTSGASNSAFEFHRMLVDWEEGTGSGDNPGGRAALDGETTWENRLHPDTPWSTPGAAAGTDFATAAAASQVVLGNGDYLWELNATGVADLQSMLDTPQQNFGWMFLSTAETTPKTARRFFMRETLTDLPQRRGPPPTLEIDFTPPPPLPLPEITALAFDAGALTLQFLATGGFTYEVEMSDSLNTGSWAVIQTFTPEGDGLLEATLPTGEGGELFARVRVVNP